jgi:hypothetical protein
VTRCDQSPSVDRGRTTAPTSGDREGESSPSRASGGGSKRPRLETSTTCRRCEGWPQVPRHPLGPIGWSSRAGGAGKLGLPALTPAHGRVGATPCHGFPTWRGSWGRRSLSSRTFAGFSYQLTRPLCQTCGDRVCPPTVTADAFLTGASGFRCVGSLACTRARFPISRRVVLCRPEPGNVRSPRAIGAPSATDATLGDAPPPADLP